MNRRHFLKHTGLLTAGALTLQQSLSSEVWANPAKSISKFGAQLYSIRDVIGKDPKAYMTQLAEMGYKQFESYSGPKGFLWGLEPKEMKTFLNGIGVDMMSTHFDFGSAAKNTDTLKKNIEMANGAGLKYLLCPYIGAQKSWDAWKKITDDFNRVGEEVRKGGLKFGYHNHDYSFRPLDGKLPQDYLLENTDAKNVMFELDLCWIDVSGVNTADHLKKYGKRYELCHVKDYTLKNGKPVQNDLGKGSVDFKQVIQTVMKTSNIKYFIVEQEEYPESPMVSMKNDAEYMKKLSV